MLTHYHGLAPHGFEHTHTCGDADDHYHIVGREAPVVKGSDEERAMHEDLFLAPVAEPLEPSGYWT